MKKPTINIFMLSAVIFFMTACQFNDQSSDDQGKAEQKCTYTFSTDSTEIIWAAYKFNDRAAVKGSFDSVLISGGQKSEKALNSLNGIRFSINTSSVNSNDMGRDKKISGIYFGALNTTDITGSIDSVDHDMKRAILSLTMNGIEIKRKVEFSLKGNVAELNANIDVKDWNGSEAIKALNKACEEKHTGKDKESVLWPDVDVLVRTRLIKDCK